MMTGMEFSSPRSIALVIFSPTTEPMLPPRNRKSITARLTHLPPILATPETTASVSPHFSLF